MTFRNRILPALLLSVAAGAAGCGGADEPDARTAASDTAGAMQGHDMSAMDGGMGGMAMDTAMMRRHAAEMDSLVNSMREHVEEMRQISPDQWHARMAEHAPLVADMVGMMDRQTREMDMGMNMSDESMGEMMGVSGEEYRAMMSETEALRTEIGQLQTAPPADVVERMPAHLDRIERMLEHMAASAAHMRM
jgi:hypothetical protein